MIELPGTTRRRRKPRYQLILRRMSSRRRDDDDDDDAKGARLLLPTTRLTRSFGMPSSSRRSPPLRGWTVLAARVNCGHS